MNIAEMQQTLSASSDAYPAGVWCELANNLMSEVERLREKNERLRYAVEYALAYDFTNAVGFYDVENVLKAALGETEAE